jgi:hypothetical protein
LLFPAVWHLTTVSEEHLVERKSMYAELSEFLRPLPKHLRRLWRPDIGTQVLFAKGEPVRIPRGGRTPNPYFNDHSYHPRLTSASVKGVGINGWNWCDQVSEYVTFDLDSIATHGDGLTDEQLAEIIGRLMDVPEAEIVRSKSGRGIHVRLYFDPQPYALTHTDHARNAARALAWLAQKTGLPLQVAVDACGKIAWIWHRDTAPNGFELLKEAR